MPDTSYINDNVSLTDLTSRLQGTIDNINTSIKTSKFGTKVLDELAKQKSILKKQIDSLKSKGDLNGEDESNSSRIIAIATSRKLSSTVDKSDYTVLYMTFGVLALAGIYYFYKKTN